MKETKPVGLKRLGCDDDFGGVQPFFTTFVPSKSGIFKINLHGPITHPDQFTWALQALESAQEEDVIEISLQSPGGSIDVADMFIHAMRKTAGHIHITAHGNCSSAATLILLQAHSFDLSEHFSSVLHCGGILNGGNFNEYKVQTTFYPQWMEKVLRNGYAGFLSEDEIDKMLDGKDIILDANAWVERYNARNQYFQAKLENAAKPPKKPRKKKADIEEAA